MALQSYPASRLVFTTIRFIRNEISIQYETWMFGIWEILTSDAPEQKVIEELSTTVGKVVHFRWIYDNANAKSKGCGYCEYPSTLIAETIIKTIKFSFNGRQVKINYIEKYVLANHDIQVTSDCRLIIL